jgi:hypothetical protein
MGRKKALTNDARTIATLRKLGEWGATREEAAAWLEVSRPTLWKFLIEFPEIAEEFEGGLDRGKCTLRRWQWASAKNGNVTMQIWLGKQLLKQRDDASQTDAYTRESIDALRGEMERKLARIIDAQSEGGLAKEPKSD